jgi:3-(3-hydroxy-phenyl)propionate hydroxylase
MLCDPRRPATIVPGRGRHRRWEFMLLPHEDDAAMMEPETVAQLLAPYIGHLPHEIVRSSTYRFHGLVAEQWQVDNVFLAGDAAHQTPPFFGQGMCHGLRDVANLAWKMAAIIKDHASPEILATYQSERDPHVRGVIGAAVAAGRYICELDPAKAEARDAQMIARAAAQAGKQETAHDLIPAIASGIILRGSEGAGERFIQPVLEDGRKLDDLTGGGWRMFTAQEATALPDNGAVAAWLAARGAEAVLIRPDHYVFGTGAPEILLAARDAQLGLQEALA